MSAYPRLVLGLLALVLVLGMLASVASVMAVIRGGASRPPDPILEAPETGAGEDVLNNRRNGPKGLPPPDEDFDNVPLPGLEESQPEVIRGPPEGFDEPVSAWTALPTSSATAGPTPAPSEAPSCLTGDKFYHGKVSFSSCGSDAALVRKMMVCLAGWVMMMMMMRMRMMMRMMMMMMMMMMMIMMMIVMMMTTTTTTAPWC
jgi:hypothetical protein